MTVGSSLSVANNKLMTRMIYYKGKTFKNKVHIVIQCWARTTFFSSRCREVCHFFKSFRHRITVTFLQL